MKALPMHVENFDSLKVPLNKKLLVEYTACKELARKLKKMKVEKEKQEKLANDLAQKL